MSLLSALSPPPLVSDYESDLSLFSILTVTLLSTVSLRLPRKKKGVFPETLGTPNSWKPRKHRGSFRGTCHRTPVVCRAPSVSSSVTRSKKNSYVHNEGLLRTLHFSETSPRTPEHGCLPRLIGHCPLTVVILEQTRVSVTPDTVHTMCVVCSTKNK